MTMHTATETFSVTHAMILDGSTRAEDVDVTALSEANGDIYGVSAGTLTADIGNYDNTGDDTVRSRWYWLNFASIQITAGYITWDRYTQLTGETITTSTYGSGTIYRVPLWSTASMNVAPHPVLIRCAARDNTGTNRYLDFVIYRVDFSPISFQGPEYKTGMRINYQGAGIPTHYDETGYYRTEESVGALIDRPAS